MAKSKKWTVEQVKKELPYVPILWNGKVWEGRVTGRLNPEASVYPYRRGTTITFGPIFHFSWQAVVHAMNTNKPLIAE